MKTNTYSTSILALLLCFAMAYAQEPVQNSTLISEGPHVFINGDGYDVIWVENGQAKKVVDQVDDSYFKKQYGFNPYLHFQYTQSSEYTSQIDFQGVDKFIALSDIHGKFEIYRDFLKAHQVIDEDENWAYGDGHLIILGDIMDRGDQVTEAMWLTYKLEMQAREQGGKVHYLAGNHEAMVMYGDVRYINKKYAEAADIMEMTHDDLFSNQSLLGNWIRKRPVMVRINDNLFVHAGLSPEFVMKNYEMARVNDLFREKIFSQYDRKFREDEELDFLGFSNGPIWYRGYFSEEEEPKKALSDALSLYDSQRMIVGHTRGNEIRVMHTEKLLAIDSGLQSGDSGEILCFQNGRFYRCFLDGTKELLF